MSHGHEFASRRRALKLIADKPGPFTPAFHTTIVSLIAAAALAFTAATALSADEPAAAPAAAAAAPAPAAEPAQVAVPEVVPAAPAPTNTPPLEVSEILKRLSSTISRAPVAPPVAPPSRLGVADAVSMTPKVALPPDSTALVALPKLSKVEIHDISDRLVMHLGAQLNYANAGPLADALPTPPAGIIDDRTLARTVGDNAYVLRFGYRHFVTQPPQLWVMGLIVDKDGNLFSNPDLALLAPEMAKMIAALNEMRAGLEVRDLEPKLVQLSYVDAATALDMLQSLGVTTIAKPSDVPAKIDFAKLPFVVKIEDPKANYTGLIGAGAKMAASKLSLSPGVASDMSDNALAAPLTQLLVMFHPAHPEQFSRVRRVLDDFIDRPARQIFIECMVLEISEQGLKELGVDWQLQDPLLTIKGGSYNTPANETLGITIPDTSLIHNVFTGGFKWDWQVRIRALIRSNKAQILSRPSVLTLDNRQSTIRVGRDIPIASSLEGMTGYSNRVSFSFEYLPTGILLNIRPRINESGKEVTMMIDTIVSATVPDADLQMRAPDKTVLASAPTVSTRRVQTYARIANNTPLIIGGLVSNDEIVTKEKVPLLGDIPLLGIAFRGEKRESEKREVIIVLTPHVLPEQKEVRRSFPKDEDAFDNFGHDLFRDSYRIRGEDVFDLTFLIENQRITLYRNLAREVARSNFRIGEAEPFRSFVQDSVPGESILVTRMVYEVIKRLNIADKVDQSRLIYFASQHLGGYDVKFLDRIVKDEATGRLKDFGGKAIAITYHRDSASLKEGRLGSEPIPDITFVECANKKDWETKLWELNQPLPDGMQQHTILIKDESDILRLRRALALKRIVVLNGGIDQMRLKNFSVGKTLLMPELKSDQIHVIDADTAMFFFHTELYYAATLQQIETQIKELDKLLQRPDIRMLLDSDLPVNGPDLQGLPAAIGN